MHSGNYAKRDRVYELLLSNGFPWAMDYMRETQNQIRNQKEQRSSLTDPLDPINYVCQFFLGLPQMPESNPKGVLGKLTWRYVYTPHFRNVYLQRTAKEY